MCVRRITQTNTSRPDRHLNIAYVKPELQWTQGMETKAFV